MVTAGGVLGQGSQDSKGQWEAMPRGSGVFEAPATNRNSSWAPALSSLDELGFATPDDTGAQLLFRFVAAAYEHRSLGIASHWPFESWGRVLLPEHTTAVSMLDRLLHHCHTVVTDGDSYRMRQARAKGGTRIKPELNPSEGWGLSVGHQRGPHLAIDNCTPPHPHLRPTPHPPLAREPSSWQGRRGLGDRRTERRFDAHIPGIFGSTTCVRPEVASPSRSMSAASSTHPAVIGRASRVPAQDPMGFRIRMCGEARALRGPGLASERGPRAGRSGLGLLAERCDCRQ